jgi:hypothetical protein
VTKARALIPDPAADGVEPVRILYVGCLEAGQTALQRFHVMAGLGHQVVGINSRPAAEMEADTRLWRRVRNRVFGPADRSEVNARIVDAVGRHPFDLLWIDKGLTVEPETLRRVRALRPGCRIVGFSLDDMTLRHCTSRQFRAHLPLYDVFFTNKSYGVADLARRGCRRAVFVDNGYDPETHRPVPVTPADRARFGGPVGFIGDYERERAGSMAYLAGHGIPVRVWGPNWGRFGPPPAGLSLERRALVGSDYARAICAFDINLGFLRKLARDRQTTRSVEIPACGGFMLAERTDEHLALFEEGREAEFFASEEELLRKVRYYLEHPEERERIALAGRERCLRGRYSNRDRLARMIREAMSGATTPAATATDRVGVARAPVVSEEKSK